MIKGLNPDPERHVTKLNIEPNTGLLLEANKGIQYNVLITRVRGQVEFLCLACWTNQLKLALVYDRATDGRDDCNQSPESICVCLSLFH